jgi:hypothetical protein
MEAFRTFYRFALWSLFLGTVGGIIAGVWFAAFEGRSINDFMRGAGMSSFYGAIIGLKALCWIGLPTATLLALLKITPLQKYRYLPYICSIVALLIFYPWWFSLSNGSNSEFIDGQFINWAVAVVVGVALFGAAYRMVSVDSRQKSKVKRSE